MKSVRIIGKDFNRKTYEEKVLHPLQSWLWGEARSNMGLEVLRIGEFKKDKLSKIYQTTFHKIPFTPLKIGYLPRSTIPSKEALTYLRDYGRRNKTVFIKIEPYVRKSSIRSIKSKGKNNSTIKQFSSLTSSSQPLFPRWTIMVDLTKPERKLLKGMRSKTRYNVRLAKRKGVYVKEMTNSEGFKIFSDLYFKTTKRQQYFGHDYNYHRTIFDTLKKKIVYILIAFYKKTPLSAYEVFLFKDKLFYPYGGSSLRYRNYMASNLLMWEVMRFGKKRGAKVFDMWGSLGSDYEKDHPWAGFTRFKEGYGGEFVEMVGSYDLVINKGLYQIYNGLYKIRQIFLKARIL